MPTEVLHLNGSPIRWDRPQKPTMMVKWSRETMYGQTVKGSLRTIAHIDRLYTLSLRRFDSPFTIIQPPYNTSIPASAGTHDYDAVIDWYIPGVPYWDQQRWARANGMWDWYRATNNMWSNHQHGGTIPLQLANTRAGDYAAGGFRVGIYVPGQLQDYYAHAFGLSGQHNPNSDKSWFPPNIKATIFDLDAYIARRKS